MATVFDTKTESIASKIVELLRPLPPENRMDVLFVLGQFYCQTCGYDQPTGAPKCRCWQDH